MSPAVLSVFSTAESTGILIRDLRITLVNLSSTGCLIETDRAFEVGTIASLRLNIDGRELTDDVQVVRCQKLEGGGSRYQVGAQFLWTRPPGQTSLRRMAQKAGAMCDGV